MIYEVKTVLSDRRKKAQSIAAADTERALTLPDFRQTSLRLNRIRYEMAIDGKDLKKEEAELVEKRDALIRKYHLVLEPTYTCTKCNDTGYLPNGRLCDCAKQLTMAEFKKKLSLQDVPKISFETTDFSVFGEDRATYEKTYEKLQTFCNRFDTTKIRNVVLLGEVGSGKTYLTACVLERMIRDGRSALFLTAFEFGRACLSHHTRADRQDVLETMLDAELLILDDLGTEPIYRNVTLEYLYSVVNERLRREKKTIISSNLSMRDLLTRYGERIFSRLNNKLTCVTLELQGKDLRRKGR